MFYYRKERASIDHDVCSSATLKSDLEKRDGASGRSYRRYSECKWGTDLGGVNLLLLPCTHGVGSGRSRKVASLDEAYGRSSDTGVIGKF